MENNINEKLIQYKGEYESVKMSDKNFEIYKAKIEQAKIDKRRAQKNSTIRKISAVAAAVVFIILIPNVSATAANAMSNIPILGNLIRIVTFRDYKYDDDNNTADVTVPEVVVDTNDISNLQIKENIIRSSAEINEKINELSDKWISEFEKNKEEEGFHDLQITSQVVRTTSSYFTLKLACYETGASGYEEHHYYTIDLNTGKELKLADLFWENTKYQDIISDNIKEQMKAQMEADENISFFIDTDMPDEDFKEISEDTEFYIDENGKVVIAFSEAEVAPAYMGCVEFVIDSGDLDNLRKPSVGIVASTEEFDSFDEIINSLDDGMWYAKVELATSNNPILLVVDMTYDYGDGNMATIYSDVYAYNENGKIVNYGTIYSGGTAYPISVSKDYIYLAGNHHVSKIFIGEKYSALITQEDAIEIFDTDANVTYYSFSLDDGFAGQVNDESKLVSLFEELEGTKPVGFTQK